MRVDEEEEDAAAPYEADEEISAAAAGLLGLLSTMSEAKATLDREDFAAVLAVCAQHAGQPFFDRHMDHRSHSYPRRSRCRQGVRPRGDGWERQRGVAKIVL